MLQNPAVQYQTLRAVEGAAATAPQVSALAQAGSAKRVADLLFGGDEEALGAALLALQREDEPQAWLLSEALRRGQRTE